MNADEPYSDSELGRAWAAARKSDSAEELYRNHPDLAAAIRTAFETAAQTLNPSSTDGREDADTLGSDGTAPMPHLSSFPGFQLMRILGEGGMGAVYLAEQEKPRRQVALKVVRPGYLSAAMIRRFDGEADILGRLDHPGVAKIFHAGTAKTPLGVQPFFAMEYIEGSPLDAYIRNAGMSAKQRLGLFAQICDAVHHAHTKGIIHRDLKPANILIAPSGDPKILDFGIARLTDHDMQATSGATSSGQIVGTLPYMAPEQAAGRLRELDTTSDVYALGIIAHELLCGKMPYSIDGMALHEAVRVICEREPSRLGSIDRSLRGDVETIVLKALDKERSRRYATAGELAADVRRFLAYEPITARPPGTWYQLTRFARRNRVFVGGVVAVLIALSAGIVTSTYYAWRFRQQTVVANEQTTLARQRLGEMGKMSQTLFTDILEKVGRVPGATDAMKTLAEESSGFLERSLKSAPDDRQFALQTALSFQRLAEVMGNFGTGAGIGNQTLADEQLSRATKILRELHARNPRDFMVIYALARALDLQAEAASDRAGVLNGGDSKSAEMLLDEAAAVLDTMIMVDDPRWIEAKSMVIRQRAAIATDSRQFERAMSLYAEAAALADRLITMEPENAKMSRSIASLWSDRGRMLWMAGENLKSMETLSRAVEKWQACVVSDPDKVITSRGLAVTLSDRSRVELALGDAKAAIQTLQDAEKLVNPLAEADPLNGNVRNIVTTIQAVLAQTYHSAGNRPAAIDASRRAMDSSRGMMKIAPRDAIYCHEAAVNATIAAQWEMETAEDQTLSRTDRLAALDRRDDLLKGALHDLQQIEKFGKLDARDRMGILGTTTQLQASRLLRSRLLTPATGPANAPAK